MSCNGSLSLNGLLHFYSRFIIREDQLSQETTAHRLSSDSNPMYRYENESIDGQSMIKLFMLESNIKGKEWIGVASRHYRRARVVFRLLFLLVRSAEPSPKKYQTLVISSCVSRVVHNLSVKALLR